MKTIVFLASLMALLFAGCKADIFSAEGFPTDKVEGVVGNPIVMNRLTRIDQSGADTITWPSFAEIHRFAFHDGTGEAIEKKSGIVQADIYPTPDYTGPDFGGTFRLGRCFSSDANGIALQSAASNCLSDLLADFGYTCEATAWKSDGIMICTNAVPVNSSNALHARVAALVQETTFGFAELLMYMNFDETSEWWTSVTFPLGNYKLHSVDIINDTVTF